MLNEELKQFFDDACFPDNLKNALVEFIQDEISADAIGTICRLLNKDELKTIVDNYNKEKLKMQNFLKELTELSKKHKIILKGDDSVGFLHLESIPYPKSNDLILKTYTLYEFTDGFGSDWE